MWGAQEERVGVALGAHIQGARWVYRSGSLQPSPVVELRWEHLLQILNSSPALGLEYGS